MRSNRKNILSAVLFWALGEGMDADLKDVSSDILKAQKNGQKFAFINEFDRTKEELLRAISKCEDDFIYLVTNDNGKRQALIKSVPDYCGILFYGNQSI